MNVCIKYGAEDATASHALLPILLLLLLLLL